MKRYITILGLLATVLFASCQDHINLEIQDNDPVQDGYVRIRFNAETPDMAEVRTKVVDPDGEDISNMTLFCFDAKGLFISTATAEELTPDAGTPSLSGTFDVIVPDITARIHFVANQNMALFEEDLFVAKSESEVMSAMEGSSGMMIYWARYVKSGAGLLSTELQGQTIRLVRNHAKISIENPSASENGYIDITGFAAVNTNAFGTVAPYCEEHEWEVPSYAENRLFVTLPHDESKLSDINEVRSIASEREQFVFESPNTPDDPVSVILRGVKSGTPQYYKVLLMEPDGDFVPIMRNHSYKINIVGDLSYGQPSFAAALEAPATNNIWISISDDIKSVTGNGYTLSVDQTHVVLSTDPVTGDLPSTLELKYTLTKESGSITTEVPSVTWLEGNTVASQTFANGPVFTPAGATGNGSVTVSLTTLAENESKREGTLLVKYGALQRKIKITTIHTQSFTPSWITTNVYGQGTGEKVTMMFNIPDTYPSELFPMEVLVSVNDLDVRNESGISLPVIRKDDPRYGKPVYIRDRNQTEDKDVYDDAGGTKSPIGYKYVMTVEQSGPQRLYLETILPHETAGTEYQFVDVVIEAQHFNTLAKRATFQDDVDNQILIHNLRSYVGSEPADEVIYFYLVPQKKGAVVEFDSHLGEVTDYGDPAPGTYDDEIVDPLGTRYVTYVDPKNEDEFLFYSNYLDHGTEEYFHFYTFHQSLWSSGGRVFGFKRNLSVPGTGAEGKGATLHLYTNSSRAEEVVRIASNPAGSPSVTGTGNSESTPYKSAVFELSTFHPFHFSAEINGSGTLVNGQNEEVDDNVSIDYGEDKIVEIAFDVTSFRSTIETMVPDDPEQLSIDPFGREFEIYIDAPMLELADNSHLVGKTTTDGNLKLRIDPNVPGRFIYTVDAQRDTERNYGSSKAKYVDQSTMIYPRAPISGIDQSGERKVIKFKTKDIVSVGDIILSSQEEEVVFYRKRFSMNNKSITGTIRFGADAGSATAVPERSFVPMERIYDGTRIGSMTVGENGTYELRLRAEYEFNWNNDPIMFEYLSGGKHYSVRINSLADLVANPNLTLTETAGH